eukprot:COSAG01_NODE_13478_length_1580_cov_2.258609_1_plen_231_part_00
MQLEGSVFGVCVIQLKPQLEALLNLPPDALTKEIRLTQDLLSLFIDYQIPSDLLRFEGPAFVDGGASSEERLAAVKGHVAALMAMIAEEKQREVDEAKLKAEAEMERMAAARAEAEALARSREAGLVLWLEDHAGFTHEGGGGEAGGLTGPTGPTGLTGPGMRSAEEWVALGLAPAEALRVEQAAARRLAGAHSPACAPRARPQRIAERPYGAATTTTICVSAAPTAGLH